MLFETGRCAYQEQGSSQTLREGLAEYRQANAAIIEDGDSEEGASLFRSHDVCHVIFGCNTSLAQEAAVDLWTIFGVDIRLRDYLAYLKLPEVQDILRAVGYGRTLRESVKALPALARVIRNARRMHKKWPWIDHEPYLDRSLASLRDEFGIRVVH